MDREEETSRGPSFLPTGELLSDKPHRLVQESVGRETVESSTQCEQERSDCFQHATSMTSGPAVASLLFGHVADSGGGYGYRDFE